MGAIVGAIGYGLGSWAGAKLMEAVDGPPRVYGPDTTIPGVTSATIKPGSKKGDVPAEKIAQVDPSQALAWFAQAAEVQKDAYQKGLTYYQSSLTQAAIEISKGYMESNDTLTPMSFSAQQALNEQMRMMGLDPISSSATTVSHARELGFSQDVVKRLTEAEQLRDPAQRAAAKEGILNSIGGSINENASTINTNKKTIEGLDITDWVGGGAFDQATLNQGNANISRAQLKAMKAAGFDPGQVYDWRASAQAAGTFGNGLEALMADLGGNKPSDPFKDTDSINITNLQGFNDYINSVSSLNKISAGNKAKIAELKTQNDKLDATNALMSAYKDQYDLNYAKEYDAGYTGAQVEAKVAATPGYQFQLDQGTKAIERQGASLGMLGSGNTLASLTKYGQGMAQNYYGMYMDNLSRIVAEGAPATMAIAANQANLGKDYGNLQVAAGQAAYDTSKAQGDAEATSLYNRGMMYVDVAKWNAGAQNQAINDAKNREVQRQTGAAAAATSYMSANNAANAFNYGMFQNQQAGAAFAGTGASGWPSYDTKNQQWTTR